VVACKFVLGLYSRQSSLAAETSHQTPTGKLLSPQYGGHLVYETNSQLIYASFVRYSFLHFHLSQMAVHHLHHLHYHHLHLLLLVYSFILNLRLGSSANPFLHRPFSFPTGLIARTLGPFIVFILLNGWICLHGVLD